MTALQLWFSCLVLKRVKLQKTEKIYDDFCPDFDWYDKIIVAFSGGKDSIGCFLSLLELGVPVEKIELWHHDVDGHGADRNPLMDWPVTPSYCKKFAEAFGVPLYFSWKAGGFQREMLRNNQPTAQNFFEAPSDEGIIECGCKTRPKNGTREKFPQVSADLSVRWCSAYLKIDVAKAAICAQDRFVGKRVLFITGERAEESSARSKYATFERHKGDNRDGRKKRHVDHWRPVKNWTEEMVWDIMREYKVNPHPAYRLGWSRLSCIACIFGSPNQWASLNKIDSDRVKKIADFENQFGCTIQRNESVDERVERGCAYAAISNKELVKQGLSEEYTDDIIVEGEWQHPAGAFGEDKAGPS